MMMMTRKVEMAYNCWKVPMPFTQNY